VRDPRWSWLSRHALDRYREFYPRAEMRDVATAMRASELVDGDTARILVSHPVGSMSERAWLLHPERTGFFLCVPQEDGGKGWTCVTFYRFYGRRQRDLALRLWPGAVPPTCDYSWGGDCLPEAELTVPDRDQDPVAASPAPTARGLASVTGRELRKISGFAAHRDLAWVQLYLDSAAQLGRIQQTAAETWLVTSSTGTCIRIQAIGASGVQARRMPRHDGSQDPDLD
jgi:hypothetical protein